VSIDSFVASAPDRRKTLTVLNRTGPEPLQRMLTALFDEQAVEVEEASVEAAPTDAVLLSEDGDPIGVSPFGRLRDALLLVNSDIYVTGARDLESVDTPAVLAGLDEVLFDVRGYPDTSKGKLLLIELSRHIEAMAFRAGAGRIHAGFQSLDRLDDERGTRAVYDLLVDAGLAVAVYGVPGDGPEGQFGGQLRVEDCEELRRSWFVVFQRSDAPEQSAALLARQDTDNRWQGYWTYDPERVATVEEYLEAEYAD